MNANMIPGDASPQPDDADDHGPECVTFSVRMPSDLYRGLNRAAREHGLSRVAILRILVKRMLGD